MRWRRASMTHDPLVSIVIVTWNGRQYLDACLSAVAAQEGVSGGDDPRGQRVDGRNGRVRARAISVGACGVACRRIADLPEATTRVCGKRAAASWRC